MTPDRAAVPLDRLATGTPARIGRVDAPGSLGDRLVELGLTPGAAVAILRRAPFGGPLQLRVREFVLSIQSHTAAGIAVLPDAV